jgi:Domain of unknown function (DUF4386)
MNEQRLRHLTGLSFILGAILINVPYFILIATFDYPAILREPTAVILTRFQAGGSSLILTWLAFAWVGLPLLFAIGLLPRVLARANIPYLGIATAIGIAGMLVQMVGLLRWVFVVPVLAQMYLDPSSTESIRAAVSVVFQAVHQYGGVVVGEHLGYAFVCLWMALISVGLLRARLFPRWVGVFGLAAAAVYSLAHGELLATVIPGFPAWGLAGLLGSLCWLAWMIALGIFLLRAAPQPRPQTSNQLAATPA